MREARTADQEFEEQTQDCPEMGHEFAVEGPFGGNIQQKA